MTRRRFILVVLLVLVVLLFLPQFGSREPAYLSVIESNWDIFPPRQAQWVLLYETDSGPSFHGDGCRYHIYSYEQEEPVAGMFFWSAEEGNTIFSKTYQEEAESWLDALNISRDLRPDYENCLRWYAVQDDNSQILIFWDAAAKSIYVAENFI